MTSQFTPERLAELQSMPYEEYLQTPEWQKKRELALKRANHRCQLCNSPDDLNVHHRTYERRGQEEPMDLTVLCEKHHNQFHGHLQEQGRAFQSVAEVMQDFAGQDAGFTSTGYKELDCALGGGLHRSNLILLGSRPGDGKSALALNIARNTALGGKTVAIFSLEMNKQQLLDRLLAMDSGVNLYRIRRGELDDKDWEKIASSMGIVQNLPIYINDEITTIDSMHNQLQQLVDGSNKPDLVIVDYIGLIEVDKYTNKQYAERAIMRELKRLARKFDVPVLALCQLSRVVGSKQDKVPQLAHLNNDQDQDANVVIFIYREDVFNPDTIRVNLVDLIVSKNSNGPIAEAVVYFRKDCVLFSDLAIQPQENA